LDVEDRWHNQSWGDENWLYKISRFRWGSEELLFVPLALAQFDLAATQNDSVCQHPDSAALDFLRTSQTKACLFPRANVQSLL